VNATDTVVYTHNENKMILDSLEKGTNIIANLTGVIVCICFLILYVQMSSMYTDITEEMDYNPARDNPAVRGNITANMNSGAQIMSLWPVIAACGFIMAVGEICFGLGRVGLMKYLIKK